MAMRGARCVYGGGSDIVYTQQLPIPQAAAHQLLVRVRACALSDLDLQIQNGDLNPDDFHFDSRGNGLDSPSGGGGGGEGQQRFYIPGYEISGVIEEVGSDVVGFRKGDLVAGLLPFDSKWGGCAELTVVDACNVVKVPAGVSHETAASSIIAGLRAYTALHYRHNVAAGDTILITKGAHGSALFTLQLATLRGARVITTVDSDEELNYLQDLLHTDNLVRIIDSRTENLVDCVLEETGGLGVDCIIDTVTSFSSSSSSSATTAATTTTTTTKPQKKKTLSSSSFDEQEDYGDAADFIPNNNSSSSSSSSRNNNDNGSNFEDEDNEEEAYNHLRTFLQCLAPHGKYLTPNKNIKIDKASMKHMHTKGISIGFLFEPCWVLSGSQQGRYLHILNNVLQDISLARVRVACSTLPLEKVRESLRRLKMQKVGKLVILNRN